MKNKLKEIKDLFKKLINDEKMVFYAIDRIMKTLLNKSEKKNFMEKIEFLINFI